MEIMELLKEFNPELKFEYDEIEYFCNDEKIVKLYKEKFGLGNSSIKEKEKFWQDNQKTILKEKLIYILLNREIEKKKNIDKELEKMLKNENLSKQSNMTQLLIKSYKERAQELKKEIDINAERKVKLLKIAAEEVGYFFVPVFLNKTRAIWYIF